MDIIRDGTGQVVARPKVRGAVIEIMERTNEPDPRVIVPNEIRINGEPVLAPADEPVVVHEVSSSSEDFVRVTLTLYARRVIVGAEAVEG